ncbi:hypothetical protein LUZ63_015431 [Rhynchospora breviuscula]|uniref:Myb/SANT-like domain-containing protein n=1 Tax=Rhynchospora breviuscula TaxID=2022672 RepID=A0A9Q0CCA8_9POAL|nr:hypothetical protein LUZ63_015431 [Rhynchospora breviuscula]
MDRALINAFVHQQDIGNKVNGSFTSKALENVVNEVLEKFPGVKLDKEKVKNRMKYIKKGFAACYDIFKNISGIAWNEDLSMWEAHPDVWDDLIKVRLEGYDTPPNAEGRKRAKRKVTLVEEVTSVKKSFQIAADAIAKVAAEMVKIQPATDTVKSQEKSPVSKSEIWKLLEELELNAVELHKAYIFLIKNPEMLDGILSCPSSELSERRDLLFEMMK